MSNLEKHGEKVFLWPNASFDPMPGHMIFYSCSNINSLFYEMGCRQC